MTATEMTFCTYQVSLSHRVGAWIEAVVQKKKKKKKNPEES